MDCELEEAYFGEKVGNVGLYQITAQQFQLECLSSNLSAGDSTGLRAYPGIFLPFFSPLSSFPLFLFVSLCLASLSSFISFLLCYFLFLLFIMC
jgi:hypothetical protein